MTTGDLRYHNLVVSPAPHIHSGASYSKAIRAIIIALVPAMVYAIVLYGMHAARVMALAASTAMATEALVRAFFRQPATLHDGSALLTGLLLALLLPPGVPWWLVVTGSFLAILVGREIFGGRGGNPFNPVLVGWAALRISWGDYLNLNFAMVNYPLGFSFEYPLGVLKKAGAAGTEVFPYLDLLLGRQAGGMGAAAVGLILAGGLFLIIRGVISWRIPVAFLAGVAGTAALFRFVGGGAFAAPMFHILAGNVMIGAFFLATDYSSSPVNRTARVIYGFGCGFLTVLFRAWSIYPDGVVFAILIMNIVNPLLDRIKPAVRGKRAGKGGTS
ncbi:MAG: RnfABCDGE type electron transport complex subunit D [Spirochaetes bacterium]|nr:RnfABCDGE type electron transport complex subunit D [Spirochaetota bacterium]